MLRPCERSHKSLNSMPTFSEKELRRLAARIFSPSGTEPAEAEIVPDSLVEANLAGHDSHGVMRIPEYLAWVEQGAVNLSSQPRLEEPLNGFAVLDGDWGWGQVIGRRAVDYAERAARVSGVATMFCRNSCHIGRAGEFPEMLAHRGLASLMFVNTHGAGRLVAPFGG